LKRKRELRSNSRYEWARPNHCSIWVDGGRRDDKHIAKVDTNTNVDASLIGHARVPLGHLPLHGDREGDCVDHAGELGQKTIAHELKDAAVLFLDLGLEELFAMFTQPLAQWTKVDPTRNVNGGQGTRMRGC